MELPARLAPLLEEFDFGCTRLLQRMAGPVLNSGNGVEVAVGPMTDAEHRWEPVPDCWSIRRHADGPGVGATLLVGAGDWGRDSAPGPHPVPPPFTTIAWRLGHLAEMLALRADHTNGSRALTRDEYRFHGDAAGAIAAFEAGVEAWRAALLDADDAALDEVGRCGYPYGGDPEEAFLDVVWWVNQEVLHHGAEIGLLRDLYLRRAHLG
ncbi:DinB family protein [Kitasatospora sp. NBC_01287]|uniref:DinB family protein n=1 Tax=Kitasatospora sp. NBC_01287 TaxID=2903573 RepID=UPI00225673BF|nr:DinB family protein [Kitasatospora sp. NBC_01287]MCX4749429.1 DinB family protein [Kitasatospora sp. NBC_01287]